MPFLFGFQAVAKLGWLEPTPIQEKAIPILLEGKDVLLRARTGSGKTGAFAIPVIQRIINSKQVSKRKMASPCQVARKPSLLIKQFFQ
jgi:ATP-dependent RNA helicase DDX56/DBP9